MSTELLLCPFCASPVLLKTERWDNPNGSEYGSGNTVYVECRCGARGPSFELPHMSGFTKHTVQEFRDNPSLRAAEEERYSLHTASVERKAIEAWNCRTAASAEQTAVPPDWSKHVRDAYLTLRRENHSIPSEVLEEMRAILDARAAPPQQPSAAPESAVIAAARALFDIPELQEMASSGSDAPAEDALGKLLDALNGKAARESEQKPTDLSKRLRVKASQPFGPEDFALLTQAADEIERYYGGMLNWKRTAEAQKPAAPATLSDEKIRQLALSYGVAKGRAIIDGRLMVATGEGDREIMEFARALLAASGNSQSQDADTERLDFLLARYVRCPQPDMGSNHQWEVFGRVIGRGQTPRAAIDAAMSKQEGGAA